MVAVSRSSYHAHSPNKDVGNQEKRAYAPAAGANSSDCLAGASTIRAAPMDDEDSHAQQFSACDEITECPHRHQPGMGKARPCREAIRLRFADGLRAASSKKMPSVT